tara:strand:+ start:361 stop:684 length:324 start_codon:yes stop_codon:yes gene_type:complete
MIMSALVQSGRRSSSHSSSAIVFSASRVKSGALYAALGNCGCAVSFWTLLYSTGVWQPVQAHSSVNVIQLGFMPLLGPKWRQSDYEDQEGLNHVEPFSFLSMRIQKF